MSLTFTSCAITCARACTLPGSRTRDVLTTNHNGTRILAALGYQPDPGADAAPTPDDPATADPVEFSLRTAVALLTTPSGYLRERLSRLDQLADHAVLHGHLIIWFHGWATTRKCPVELTSGHK